MTSRAAPVRNAAGLIAVWALVFTVLSSPIIEVGYFKFVPWTFYQGLHVVIGALSALTLTALTTRSKTLLALMLIILVVFLRPHLYPFVKWSAVGVAVGLTVSRFLRRDTAKKRILYPALIAAFAASMSSLGLRLMTDADVMTGAFPLPRFEYLYRHLPRIRLVGERHGDLSKRTTETFDFPRHRFTFQTDSRGFVNPAGHRDRPNKFIVISDSFGNMMPEDFKQSFCGAFETSTGSPVYNLSCSGLNIYQEMLMAKAELPLLQLTDKPLVIWLLYAGNDLEGHFDDNLDLQERPLATRLAVHLRNHQKRCPLTTAFMRFHTSGQLKTLNVVSSAPLFDDTLLFHNRVTRNDRITVPSIKASREYHISRRAIADMKRFLDARGVALRCVIIPTKNEIYQWCLDGAGPWTSPADASSFSRSFEPVFTNNGIPAYDLKNDFLSASRRLYERDRSLLYWADDTHWNETGQMLAAERVGRWIEEGNATVD